MKYKHRNFIKNSAIAFGTPHLNSLYSNYDEFEDDDCGLLKNVCDIHVHASPDTKGRAVDEIDFALDAKNAGYRKRTMPIDSFKPNNLGLFNMHGNVAEWCWEIYGNYNDKKFLDPNGSAGGKLRLCRGRGWNDFGKHFRSAFRSAADPFSFIVKDSGMSKKTVKKPTR